MKILPAILLCATTNAALAQVVITAEEFDSLSVGTTLFFSEQGIHYGAEQFFKDRRTVWRAADGRCINGIWDAVADGICFLYEDQNNPHCWRITRANGTITITSMFDLEGETPTVLDMSGQNTTPISCEGPIFGV